jgi:hypothetical protein
LTIVIPDEAPRRIYPQRPPRGQITGSECDGCESRHQNRVHQAENEGIGPNAESQADDRCQQNCVEKARSVFQVRS